MLANTGSKWQQNSLPVTAHTAMITSRPESTVMTRAQELKNGVDGEPDNWHAPDRTLPWLLKKYQIRILQKLWLGRHLQHEPVFLFSPLRRMYWIKGKMQRIARHGLWHQARREKHYDPQRTYDSRRCTRGFSKPSLKVDTKTPMAAKFWSVMLLAESCTCTIHALPERISNCLSKVDVLKASYDPSIDNKQIKISDRCPNTTQGLPSFFLGASRCIAIAMKSYAKYTRATAIHSHRRKMCRFKRAPILRKEGAYRDRGISVCIHGATGRARRDRADTCVCIGPSDRGTC